MSKIIHIMKKILTAIYPYILVFLFYCLISFIFFGSGIGIHLQSRIIGTSGSFDQFSYIWELLWWPYAVIHHLNPFFTKLIWYPYGQNMVWVQTVPGAAILALPLTLLISPIVAYNLITIYAAAFSAFTAFILIKYITKSWKAGIIGGYFFGFSTYQIAQLVHLSLILTFDIPLIVYICLKFWNKEIKGWVFIISLGLLLALQYLLSSEELATFTVFGSIGILLLWLFWRERFKEIVTFAMHIVFGYLFMLVIISPFLYFTFRYGLPPSVDNSPVSYSTDFLNLFIPTGVTFLGGGIFNALSYQFIPGLIESNGYIGIPLIALCIAYFSRHWKQRITIFLCFLLCFIILSSFGVILHVAGFDTIWHLPWRIFGSIPLLKEALPVRFMLYADLVIAIIVGLWVVRKNLNGYVKYGLILLAIVFTVPYIPYSSINSEANIPYFFTSGIYKSYIARNADVLIIPYGGYGDAMLWQAYTNMYFTMPEGYVGPWTTSPKPFLQSDVPAILAKRVTVPSSILMNRQIMEKLLQTNSGNSVTIPNTDLVYSPSVIKIGKADIETFLTDYKVKVIIIDKLDASYYAPMFAELGVKGVVVKDLIIYKL